MATKRKNPSSEQPASKKTSAGDDDVIASVQIYPAIGIMRVGNSTEYYLGPELPFPVPKEKNFNYKDGAKIKREAARFRIYAFNKEGQVLREITANGAAEKIQWRVHVANKKASWYNFDMAPDVPSAPPVARRNPEIKDRSKLIIDAGNKTIEYVKGIASSTAVKLVGSIMNLSGIYLGELQTDADGKLIVLPGLGRTGMWDAKDAGPSTFGNNDGWYDDTCDGPVRATVTINGRPYEATPAWVSSAPPNYGPEIVSPKSMYDLVCDTLYSAYQQPYGTNLVITPGVPSFQNDILPIFKKLSNTQWVNGGFDTMFGYKSQFDFEFNTDGILEKLSFGGKDPLSPNLNPSAAVYADLRQFIFRMIRKTGEGASDFLWPPIYSDNPLTTPANSNSYLTVTALQQNNLTQWVKGNFINDFNPNPPTQTKIEDFPLAQQPDTLTHAALHFCMGGAFHPGCELPFLLRISSVWDSGLRIRQEPESTGVSAVDCGDYLQPCGPSPNATYPYLRQGPGDITKWMAIPWHCDTASCRAAYREDPARFGQYLNSFWPSRVPNTVLSESSFQKALNATDDATKLAAFKTRVIWYRGLGLGSHIQQITNMVNGDWSKMGIIVKREIPPEKRGNVLPPYAYVESGYDLGQVMKPVQTPTGTVFQVATKAEIDESMRVTNAIMFNQWADQLHRNKTTNVLKLVYQPAMGEHMFSQ